MKHVNKMFLMLTVVCAMASIVNAATVTSYTASDSPGSAPDGNGNTVDVWTVTGDDGPSRSFLAGTQDGNANVWTVWDLDGGAGTYATHTFAGGALDVGQSVSIDWTHNSDIDTDTSIGVRFLDGSNTEVAVLFEGGKLVFSQFDTAAGVTTDIAKFYDRYDFYQVVFTLTGTNSYEMSISEGSIPDNPTGLGNGGDDGNPDVGEIVDVWTGTFTGASITGIQVYTEGGGTSDQWFDNLDINEDWVAAAHDPVPAYGQEDVITSGLELSWTIPQVRSLADPNVFVTDPNLASFNLYYNTNDPNLAVTPVSVTGWDTQTLRASHTPVPELAKNSTIYWRVDAVLDDASVIEGDNWVFFTELTKAVILTEPVRQLVDAGSTAEFSVVVSSETPPTYQWYEFVDGVNDTVLTDGGDISGATTDTLSIANAEVADEAEFYCIVNNDSGVEVMSEIVLLTIKRKLAYWPFDGNVLDSVIPGSPASVVVGEPSVTADSIAGDAMVFDNDVDMLYTDPNRVSYFDVCNYQMTVACWVKTTDSQQWAPLVARNGDDGQGWQLRQNGFTGDRPSFTTRGTGNEDGTPANRTIYDGQWHYVVGTFDGTVKKVYIDGIVSRTYSVDDGSVLSDGDGVIAPINASESPVAIAGRVSGSLAGGLNVQTGNIVAGIYDEIEIYNYALDATAVAQIYADLTGTGVCFDQAYDLNGDCVVNMFDFGLLSSEWLNDQLIQPTP